MLEKITQESSGNIGMLFERGTDSVLAMITIKDMLTQFYSKVLPDIKFLKPAHLKIMEKGNSGVHGRQTSFRLIGLYKNYTRGRLLQVNLGYFDVNRGTEENSYNIRFSLRYREFIEGDFIEDRDLSVREAKEFCNYGQMQLRKDVVARVFAPRSQFNYV